MDRTRRHRTARLGRRPRRLTPECSLDAHLAPGDTFAIERLYAQYSHAIRLGDGEAWAACFTPDGIFSNPRERVTGREALSAYANDFSKPRNARYWLNNLLLEPDGEGARGSCYLLLLHVGGGNPASIELTGLYTDAIVRSALGWKFAARHVAGDR